MAMQRQWVCLPEPQHTHKSAPASNQCTLHAWVPRCPWACLVGRLAETTQGILGSSCSKAQQGCEGIGLNILDIG